MVWLHARAVIRFGDPRCVMSRWLWMLRRCGGGKEGRRVGGKEIFEGVFVLAVLKFWSGCSVSVGSLLLFNLIASLQQIVLKLFQQSRWRQMTRRVHMTVRNK